MKKFFNLKKLNKKGAGLVAVIVAIAFVSMLASILLCTSYMNYRTKTTNLKAKDTFYSAEKALDEISMGLQTIVSDAISKSYLEVINYYSVYTADRKNDLMEDIYYNHLFSKLAEDPVTHVQYKVDILKSFVTQPWDETSQSGVIVSSSTAQMITYASSGIVLKNVEVYYRDPKGYSSTIKTDIRLACPTVDFGAITTLPDILDYAMIADKGVTITATAGTTSTITGSVYGDFITVNNPANPDASHKANVVFANTSSESEAVPSTFISKNDITLNNSWVSFPADAEIWSKSIVQKSTSLSLPGKTYLSNDIVINGTGSELKVSGDLFAYGNSLDDASQSSAILVNGKNTSIDFTGAGSLMIAGHAFVGVKDVNRATNPTTVQGLNASGGKESKQASVYTGESIAVKSNQLMYLIPGECIGVANGKSLFGVNPLTASQYASVTSGSLTEVEIFLPLDRLGGHTLADYIKRKTEGSDEPVFEKLFVQTNGQTMVYYYMTFRDEDAANAYFQDYYANNTKRFTSYMQFYTDMVKIPDPTAMVRVQTAGNGLTFDGTDSELFENTMNNGSDRLNSASIANTTTFATLCTKLLKDYSSVAESAYVNPYEGDIIFDNLIFNDAEQNGSIQKACQGETDHILKYADADCVALLMDNSGSEFTFNNHFTVNVNGVDYGYDKIHLIIATGNVRIVNDFNGLILCDGTISVDSGAKVTADSELTKEALRLVDDHGFTIYQYFRDGSGFSKTNGTGETSSSSLSELVVFENWSKQ